MATKLSEAQRTQVKAARLLQAGKPAAQVALAVGVARQTVYTWKRVLDESPQIVEFLKALRRHIKRKLLIIWDGLQAHRGRLVRDYLDSTKGAIQVSFLPCRVARPQGHRQKQAQLRSASPVDYHGMMETG